MKKAYYPALIAGLVLAALPIFARPQSGQEISTTSPASTAAPALPPDQQATKEQIEKLFDVLRLRKQMQQMLGMMPAVVQQSFQDQMKNLSANLPPGKQLTAQDEAALEKVMNKYMQEAIGAYPVEEMLTDAIPVYQRHVSRTDADAVIAFYSSPPGQRLLDEQPAIMNEYMPIVMSHMQERTKHLTEDMAADMRKALQQESAVPDPSVPASH